MIRRLPVLIACVLLPAGALAGEPIAFGTLPALQALPLYVAQEKGFFEAEGLKVELVPFKSGLEKDSALAAGKIHGYFGDMLTSILFASNFAPARMVATVYNTTGSERMFGVLAAPGTGKPTLPELAQKGIAGSSNTLIEYVTRWLLNKQAPYAPLAMIESKDITLRLPMLLQGQVAGAVLPEPLVTLAERKGATVVADDRGTGISPTVLLFTDDFLAKRPDDARRFMRAVAKASELIGMDPEGVRASMVKLARVPEELAASYPVPRFPTPAEPDKVLVSEAYAWLKEKGILKTELSYEKMVAQGFLR